MTLADRLIDAPTLALGGRTWRLVITYGVLLDCQEATGIDMLGSIEAFVQPSAKVLQHLLWAMMRREKASLILGDVGAMIRPGNIPNIRQAVANAFVASMPEPPKKKPGKGKGAKPAKAMTWPQTWALARMELGLTDDDFREITPRLFHALREVSVDRMRRAELLNGILCECIVNFSMARPKKPMKAVDFMIHRFPDDEAGESVCAGDQLLGLLKEMNG